MNASTDKRNGNNTEHLLSDYIALCNRAMAENRDKFWYQLAKRLNRALWGGADFRTLVYEEDPDNVIGEFTIHFDAEGRMLRLLPPGDHDVAFSWKVSTAYLSDVVLERPDWYLEHPTMLDWIWIRERVRDEASERVDGCSLAAGFLLGAAATLLAVSAFSRDRAGPDLRLR